MPWINDVFYYTTGTLRAIADWYDRTNEYGGYSNLYEVAEIGWHNVTSSYSLMEFKADFDRSLNAIGCSNWRGVTSHDFWDYRHFGKKQRIIIAYILGIRSDYNLQSWGFWDARKYRHKAFREMVAMLNERRV